MAAQAVSKWRCRVCGYIHESPEPPETCPVCGVSQEEFEEYEQNECTTIAKGPSSKWRCKVCGHVHGGSGAPDTCPVCGVSKEEFELIAPEPAETATEAHRWRCKVCGYVHEGPAPPETCPICGVSKDEFELQDGPVESVGQDKEEQLPDGSKVVVIGGGVAGVAAVEAICKRTAFVDVTLVSAEPALPYYRINLTRLIADEINETELPLHAEEWYKQKKVTLLRNVTATRIDRGKQRVDLDNGEVLPYDRVVMATGAAPSVPPIPGVGQDHVHTVRTINDARDVIAQAQTGPTCVCIGGGILGLETAGGLSRRGSKVTILEGAPWLMPRQFNQAAANKLAAAVEQQGIVLVPSAKITEITPDAVHLEDGRCFPADLVVVATGVRPDLTLAEAAGLDVNRGVIVNDYLQTSDPSIYAAGDVAEHQDKLYGLWMPAQYMGGIAGLNAAGGKTQFGGIPLSTSVKVLGLETYSIGQFEAEEGDIDVSGEIGDAYYHFIFHEGVLVGANLIGDASLSNSIKNAIEEGVDLSGLLAKKPSINMLIDYLKTQ